MTTDPGDDAGPGAAVTEQLETYLDDLLVTLRGRPREVRRLLSEAESHLLDSVAAGIAAGLSEEEAAERALARFGPPSAVARSLPPGPAYRALLGQLAEAVLCVLSLLFLAAGAAAIPAGILGLAGKVSLVTGDRPGQSAPAGRCQQLRRLAPASSCPQALTIHHLEEVIRSHLLAGWFGVILLGLWWGVHVHRRGRPAVLPAGFVLTVSSTLLAAVAVFLLGFGVPAAAAGHDSSGSVMGSGDLVATGATMMAAALAGWAVLARQATRPARHLAAGPRH